MSEDLETRTAKEIVTALEIASPDPIELRESKIRVIANFLKQLAAMEKRIAQLEKIVIGPTTIDCGQF